MTRGRQTSEVVDVRGEVVSSEGARGASAPPPARPTPPGKAPRRSLLGALTAFFSAGFSGLYLLNPGFGLLELIPDNAPGIGNLDEAGATVLFLYAMRYLFLGPRSKGGEGPEG